MMIQNNFKTSKKITIMEKNKQVSSHTPGEWLFAEHMGDTMITAPDNTKYNRRIPICEVNINPQKPEEGLANCKLIASAPTLKAENEKLKADKAVLLEALKNAIKFIKCTPKLGHDEDRPKGLERWEQLIELNK